MDIYLPADFHRLHDDVAEDWRDVSSTPIAAIGATLALRVQTPADVERSVDLDWVAI